jgi:hypothetical protein
MNGGSVGSSPDRGANMHELFVTPVEAPPMKITDLESLNTLKDKNGKLPTYNYQDLNSRSFPVFYRTKTVEVVCSNCVNDHIVLIEQALERPANHTRRWQLVSMEINYNEPMLHCDRCGKQIECIYEDTA